MTVLRQKQPTFARNCKMNTSSKKVPKLKSLKSMSIHVSWTFNTESGGVIYYISMLSTTGGKLKVSPKKILKRYSKIKNHNKSKNVVIGFGITEKTIKSLRKADGLVVGSAICKEISNSIKKRQNAVTNVTNIVKRLKNKIK